MDPDFREAESYRNYSSEVTIPGQIVGKRGFARLDRRETGDMDSSTGTIMFKMCTLKSMGITLEKGDRIVAFIMCDGREEHDFNITQVNPLAPLRGRTILVAVQYEEQKKIQETI